MSKLKIWAVTEGPINIRDINYNDTYEKEHPEGGKYFNVCKVERDGKLFDLEFWFNSKASAYEFKHHVDAHMDAIEVNDDELDELDDID